MKRQTFWVLLSMMILINLFVGACVFSFPERRVRNFHVDLQFPLQGAVLDLSETFLFANVYHPGRELSRLVFYANGRNIGEIIALEADTVDPRSYGEINWTPPTVGEYLLQVQADALEGPDVMSAPVRVCVIDFEIEGGTFDTNFGYEGGCDISFRSRFAVPGIITLAALATPDRLTYDDVFHEPPCPVVKDARLSFEATVEDPPDDVVFVVVYYSMTYGPSAYYPGETRTHALVLTRTGSVGPSTEIYTGHTEDLSAYLSNYFYRSGAGEIIWSARAIGRSGETLLEDGPHTIPARSSCGFIFPAIAPSPTAGAALPALPTLTPTPAPTLEPTSTSTRVPNVPPTKKPADNGGGDGGGGGDNGGGSPPVTCGDYGDKDKCTAAGCKWDPDKSTCN